MPIAELVHERPKLYVVQGLQVPEPASALPTQKASLGPQFHALETVEIPERSAGWVPIDLRRARKDTSQYAEKLAKATGSLRSNMAQRGAEMRAQAATTVLDGMLNTNNASVGIPILNHSYRPLTVEEGPVAQFYTRGAYLEGEELLKSLDAHKITMSGEEGSDWWLHYDKTGQVIGVGYRLAPSTRTIVADEKPIRIQNSASGAFRAELDKYLTPIPPEDSRAVRIGTTASEVGFGGDDIVGIIEPHVDVTKTPEGFRPVNRWHLNAILLKPGYKWPIRTEERVYGDDTGIHEKQEYVVFQFMPLDQPVED